MEGGTIKQIMNLKVQLRVLEYALLAHVLTLVIFIFTWDVSPFASPSLVLFNDLLGLLLTLLIRLGPIWLIVSANLIRIYIMEPAKRNTEVLIVSFLGLIAGFLDLYYLFS